MDCFQILIGANGVPLIHPLVRATIPYEMLSTSKYVLPRRSEEGVTVRMVCWWLPLKTADDGGQRAHDLWVLAVAFVASAPPRIPTDGDAGREGPVDASGANLERRRLADPTRELSVPGGAETDVVGEHGGAVDVVVAVDGVGAVEDGDAEAGGEGEALHAVDHGGPVGGGGSLAGRASPGVEDAARPEVREGARRRDGALDLGHLRRLLTQRHAAQQVLHPRLHRRRCVPVHRRRLASRHRAGEQKGAEAEEIGREGIGFGHDDTRETR